MPLIGQLCLGGKNVIIAFIYVLICITIARCVKVVLYLGVLRWISDKGSYFKYELSLAFYVAKYVCKEVYSLAAPEL